METVVDYLGGAPKSLQMVTAARKLKDASSLKKSSMTNLDSTLKSRDSTLPAKVRLVKAMVFPVVLNVCLRDGLKRNLSTKELMLLNYGVGEDSRSGQSSRKSALNIHWKD